MAGSPKLRKGDISLLEFYILSKKMYSSHKADKNMSKKKRAKLDIVGGKITALKNFTFDKNEGKWKTTNKRSVRIEILISSKPVSYEKHDRIPVHKYPITVILYDIELGLNSPFKFRSGSLKKPIFAPKGCGSEKRLKIEETNIRNGVDFSFLIHLEKILWAYKLLFGPCYANRFPTKANPEMNVYFDKHTYFAVTKVLIPLFNNPMALSKLKKMSFINEDKK